MTRKNSALARYVAKRDFSITPEPEGGGRHQPGALQFVIQKHWARRLHYDFRLELQGTMKSWAVPKGPSLDPRDKRMAVHVEDHPLGYNQFEGEIPAGQYGAGKVIIWDRGTWAPQGDPAEGYRKGHLKFQLQGHKLHGAWALVRMKTRDSRQDAWLLIKEKDDFARPATEFSVVDEMPDSAGALPPLPAPRRSSGAMPEGAKRAPMPAELKPQLATLVTRPPQNAADWLYEIKFDGYRILARIDSGGIRLLTRNGHDWTHKLRHLQAALRTLRLKPGWLDGEIVMLNDKGTASFQELQNAFDSDRTAQIVYFVFDLPWYGGHDLTAVPLVERRALLQSLLHDPPSSVRFSDTFEAPPGDLVASACRLGLEGIIGKRRDGIYTPRRSPEWIKLKCAQRQEFVIGGWTEPSGSRSRLGALLLGVHDPAGNLKYAGKVGTGFTQESLSRISRRLAPLAHSKSPFTGRVPATGGVHWVRPRLVAEVTFSEWTRGGHLRQPVFHALRSDKPARSIVKEDPVAPLGPDSEESSLVPAQLRVSHPERIVDTSTGITKIDIIRYYALVGGLMMPHLQHRPVSWVKAPQGLGRKAFFQKHAPDSKLAGVALLPRRLDPQHPPYLEVASSLGLLSAAQVNVIEFHTWNAVKSGFRTPDRMVFDLDPGEGTAWAAVQQAAQLMRGFLAELKLAAFLKTSGGKGLHVVTPLRPEFDWDTVKAVSQAVVVHMASTLPQRFVARSGARNRVGKVFIDYLRNGFGATTVCAWSARARPGMGISVPVDWSELPGIASGSQWSLRTAHSRLAAGNQPWDDYQRAARSLKAAMKLLEFRPKGRRAGRRTREPEG